MAVYYTLYYTDVLYKRSIHTVLWLTLLRNFINRKNASLVSLKFHHSCRLFWSFLHILETLNLKLHCCRGNYDLSFTFLKLWAQSYFVTNGCSFHVLEILSLKLHHYRWNFDLFFMFLKLWAQNSHNILKLSARSSICCNWNFNLLFIFLKFWVWSSIIASEILVFFSHFWNFSYVRHF